MHKNLVYQRDVVCSDMQALIRKLGALSPNFANFSTLALKRMLLRIDVAEREVVQAVIHIRAAIESHQDSLDFFDRTIEKSNFLRAESGISDAAQMQGSITTLQQDENFKETAGVAIEKVSAGVSYNSQQGQRNVLGVDDFFSRPVEIYKSKLTLHTDFDVRLSVWDLYSSIPSVRAKMRNFAYMRGNLHVRLSVSGTPFHYGRLLVSYQPYAVYNQTIKEYTTAIALHGAFRSLFQTYLSQSTGSALMNMNSNEPLEVICPFISTKPMHRLFNAASTVLGAGTSFTDFLDTGDLFVTSLVPFSSVSASPSAVYLQVYAWMEDVEMGTNTATQIAITTESGSDERKTGPVQRFASSALKVSQMLQEVPVIGIFAKASSMVLGALGGVASLFGWSKPIMIDKPLRYCPTPFQNGALTIGYDTNKRVVLDPMQELTVDNRVCGTSEDELVISTIASKVSYYTQFVWHNIDVALTTPIWSTCVTPNLGNWYFNTPNYWNQPTAMAFAAAPFFAWRGNIVFRFEVVCSAFHRGKLGVYFEPNLSQNVLITASTSLNKQFIKIVDIQETQVFEVEVPWASYRPWLQVGQANQQHSFSDPSSISTTTGFCNGFISVFPFTDLQSPDSSDINILVYAYCPDLQVNGMTSRGLPTSRLRTASGPFTGVIRTESGNCIQPVEVTRVPLNESSATLEGLCDEYFGEQPVSFRALLKRYVHNQQMTTVAVTTQTSLLNRPQIFPVNGLPYGNTSWTHYPDLFSYLRYAYLGIRGGIRARMRMCATQSINSYGWIKIGLDDPDTSFPNDSQSSADPGGATMAGTVTFVPGTNGAAEVELPFYSNNLFALSFSDTYDDGALYADNMEQRWYRSIIFRLDIPTKSIAAATFDVERAAGEDFSYMRFQGAPWFAST